jgi:hypothetical protein
LAIEPAGDAELDSSRRMKALAIGDGFSLSRIDAGWKSPLWRGPTQFAAIIELLDSAWVQVWSFMHSLLLRCYERSCGTVGASQPF